MGEKVLTYRDGGIKYGKVSAYQFIGFLPSYKLTFDNGESVIASGEHKWPVKIVQDKKPWLIETKHTAELEVGQRMVPCRVGEDGHGYKTWYSEMAALYVKQHILVAEAFHGPIPKDHHVHHKDSNRRNNHPSNLEYKLGKAHCSDHGKDNYKKQDHKYRLINKEYVGLQPMWAITVESDHNYILSCGVVTYNSQIEPRVAAHRSGDQALIDVYLNEEDVYSDFAITAFHLQDDRYRDAKGKWVYPHVDKEEHCFSKLRPQNSSQPLMMLAGFWPTSSDASRQGLDGEQVPGPH